MKIIRKFGIGLAATVAGFGLLGISAPAHAQAVTPSNPVTVSVTDTTTTSSSSTTTSGGSGTTVNRLDLSWGGRP